MTIQGCIAHLARQWASNTWVIDGEGLNPTEAAPAVVAKVMVAVVVQLLFMTVVTEAMTVVVDLGWGSSISYINQVITSAAP